MTRTKAKKSFNAQKMHDVIFMSSMLALPIVIFLIFYVYVHLDSFLLGFKEYDIASDAYIFVGFKNFIDFYKSIFNDADMGRYFINSFINYGVGLLGMPLSILVSNHIYKKFPGAKTFRILLFLPSIIPSMVWILMFRYFVERVLPVFPTGETYLTNPDTTFWTLLLYDFWIGFAGGMVLYTGAMSRIPPDLVEYGELDGLKGIKEFWHLTVPLIFPTITVFLVTGVAGIFTNQLRLYGFFGNGAPTQAQTLGYYFFASLFEVGSTPSKGFFPTAAASGLSFTIVVAPITLLVRYLLEKFGPSAEY